jgi:hypothetical protein
MQACFGKLCHAQWVHILVLVQTDIKVIDVLANTLLICSPLAENHQAVKGLERKKPFARNKICG